VPLAEQDRSLWDRDAIAEGLALVSHALSHARVGPYQVQAAIAAVHAEAERPNDTNWREILGLYELLERLAPNPVVTLNRAVAVAMVFGPDAGLDVVSSLEGDQRMTQHHRVDAVRAHLLEMRGDDDGARAGFRAAARRTTSLPERRYLELRAARLQ
jgi:predicted RNA polymerase sigma factor